MWCLSMKIKNFGIVTWALALIFLLLDLLAGSISTGTHLQHMVHFSLRHAITPLLGIWGGLLSVILLFLGKGLIHIYAAFGSRLLLFWHLPTLCGTLYFTLMRKNALYARIIATAPATICMMLFWIHPVGQTAFLYPIYWVIPVVVAIMNKKSFFLQALGSTFTAHAVGSVLWLYGGLLTSPVAWITLIPVVAYERIGFACLMTSIFYGSKGLTTLFKTYLKKISDTLAQPLRNNQNP